MLPLIAFALQQASVSVEIGSKSGAKVQVVAHESADSTHGDSLRAKRKPIVVVSRGAILDSASHRPVALD
jgi:hypothetical protein